MIRMPYAGQWQRILTEFYDESTPKRLVSKARGYYEEFRLQYSSSSYSKQRAVLNSRILPGLSIYKALCDEDHDREKILGEVEVLFRRTFFTVQFQGLRLLKYLPDPFPIIKPALKLMTADEYMPGSQEIITDNADCYAITIYRCFIFDVLASHNAQEMTAIYCKTDDWLAEALPRVGWERTKTIGRGDDCCDFRWCRIK